MQSGEVLHAVIERADQLTPLIREKYPDGSANAQVSLEVTSLMIDLFIEAGLTTKEKAIKFVLGEIDKVDPGLRHELSPTEDSDRYFDREFVAALQVGKNLIGPEFPQTYYNKLQELWMQQNQDWNIKS